MLGVFFTKLVGENKKRKQAISLIEAAIELSKANSGHKQAIDHTGLSFVSWDSYGPHFYFANHSSLTRLSRNDNCQIDVAIATSIDD
jgi:hypothetical protein